MDLPLLGNTAEIVQQREQLEDVTHVTRCHQPGKVVIVVFAQSDPEHLPHVR